jgi:predicted dehydrogenase
MDYGKHSGVVLKRNRIGLARKDIELNEKNALAAELEDFIAAVNASRASGSIVPAKVSGEAGLKALALATAIEKEVRDYNERYGFKFCAPPAVED